MEIREEMYIISYAIGPIIYASYITYLKLAYAMREVSQHSANLDKTCWHVVRIIFCYLNGTPNKALHMA